MKMDLALNKLQSLICHKPDETNISKSGFNFFFSLFYVYVRSLLNCLVDGKNGSLSITAANECCRHFSWFHSPIPPLVRAFKHLRMRLQVCDFFLLLPRQYTSLMADTQFELTSSN